MQYPDASVDLPGSLNVDLFPWDRPDLVLLMDGAIGERSLFREAFGYPPHGMDETPAGLSIGWWERLSALRSENAGHATGGCWEVHDRAAFDLVAGREQNLDSIGGLLRHGPVQVEEPRFQLDRLPVAPVQRELVGPEAFPAAGALWGCGGMSCPELFAGRCAGGSVRE